MHKEHYKRVLVNTYRMYTYVIIFHIVILEILSFCPSEISGIEGYASATCTERQLNDHCQITCGTGYTGTPVDAVCERVNETSGEWYG